jgi:hypothetical protein
MVVQLSNVCCVVINPIDVDVFKMDSFNRQCLDVMYLSFINLRKIYEYWY